MKKKIIIFLLLAMLFTQIPAINAADIATKQDWVDAVEARKKAGIEHQQAKAAYQANKSPENNKKVIDTGKDVLIAALDESEAWILWKNHDAQIDHRVPDTIKQDLERDKDKNIKKITDYRPEINAISTQAELLTVFVRMAFSYAEFMADVARNTGAMWVHISYGLIDTSEEYEAKLRVSAEKMPNNTDLIDKLNMAKNNLDSSRSKVKMAEPAYKLVVFPGLPLLKFAEGNQYLREAKINLNSAQTQLYSVFMEIAARSIQ